MKLRYTLPMIWNLHGVIIEGLTNDATLRRSWHRSFASLPESTAAPDLVCRLDVVAGLPLPPPGQPQFSQEERLHYYVAGSQVIVHFPRYGQLHLDLDRGVSEGRVLPAVMQRYGVLEDLIAISLSPHLRRLNQFLIHAFGAAYEGKAVLLVGGIGAGKTTTGIALLDAGWRLLSNDSPIIATRGDSPEILSYPGVLAAYPDTFNRFAVTSSIVAGQDVWNGDHESGHRRKITLPAERIWPGVWLDAAPLQAILFPEIERRQDHTAEFLPPPAALTRLMPHAMEQWDKMMLPAHLTLLRRLVELAPAYRLRLGTDVPTIPHFVRELVA
jgi:hypothetical protein